MEKEKSERRTSDDTAVPIDYDTTPNRRTTDEQTTGLEDTTLNPGAPRPWHTPMSTISMRLWRQLLGLNPFKGSYFGLYATLEGVGDRTIASCGVLFAIAAGVPLPIIVSS
jgi:hypothetical protein